MSSQAPRISSIVQLHTQVQALTAENTRLQHLVDWKAEQADLLLHDLKTLLYKGLSDAMMQKQAFALINQLGKSQQATQAQLIVKREVLALQNLIQEAVALTKIGKFNLRTHLFVRVDSGLTIRILHNLLSNAQKFAHKETEVEIKVVEMPERMAKVSVLNKGISIPQAWQERIFDKHAQCKNSGNGSGLGLYFCQQAVRAMGGEIGVVSEQGQTEFWFTLLLHQAEKAPDDFDILAPDAVPLQQLQALEIWDYSEIMQVLDGLEGLEQWKQAVKQAVEASDEQGYSRLIQRETLAKNF